MPNEPAPQPVNRRIVLARRPQGAPQAADFRLEQQPLPLVGPGQVLLRTRYLSLDPYMRGRMSDVRSYAPSVAIDAPMVGQTVSEVVVSKVSGLLAGELVVGNAGWQDYALSDGRDLRKIDPAMQPPSLALGILGMTGLTAYVGLIDIGQPQPGETVVVAAATGAVGAAVGQIAKIKGCRAVGIAGGRDKCAYAVDTLGFDACVDHRAPELAERLKGASPKGIDVYFENVGGAVLGAVIPLLNRGARMPLCGLVSWYNLEKLPAGVDHTPQLLFAVLRQRVRIQGFLVFDHHERTAQFLKDMGDWVREGRVKYREQVVEGLENAPEAFMGLLRGENFGKLLVRVS